MKALLSGDNDAFVYDVDFFSEDDKFDDEVDECKYEDQYRASVL